MPVTQTELSDLGMGSGGGGGSNMFFRLNQELKPGDSIRVKLFDINKNTRTKFPLKDKNYCYQVKFDQDGRTRLYDLNSFDAVRQALKVLYPNGTDKAMSPCYATITRRLQRPKKKSEVQIERVGDLPVSEVPSSGGDDL